MMAPGLEVTTEVHTWSPEKVDRVLLALAAITFSRWRVELGRAGR